jgi:6-phosphogluconolactonase
MNIKSIGYLLLGLFLIGNFSCGTKPNDDKETGKPEAEAMMSGNKLLFTGAYTKKEGHVDGKADGIDIYSLSSAGELEHLSTSQQVINPSYLALSDDGRFLYAVQETGADVDTTGSVTSFRINAEDGSLELINTQPSYGFAPCYITVDSKNRMAFVVNYVGGIVLVYPLAEDGSLNQASQVLRLEGSGSHSRQESSHPHSVILSRDEQYVFVADLGTDLIMIYKVDYQKHELVPAGIPSVSVSSEAGPRHMVFDPEGDYLYVVNELSSSVSVFSFNRERGELSFLQEISTLPDDFEGESWCADIHISNDGKYLYASNRGHDSLVIFGIEEDGSLSLIGYES